MPRVIHFEIHAEDVERAKKFYEDIFGWKIEKWGGPMDYWSITTGKEGEPGIDGGLMKRQGKEPGEETVIKSYVCTIDVPDIDEYLNKIKQHGGKVAMEKGPIPSIGWLAYCFDTEKNLFGTMQPDMSAK
ncbi:VOC family protein [Methanosarcina sp. DH2]|uniref:VOC family protein n=1 Tax=Methanosarcina sp. DH2 TaxID=2605639 RepID=UPI001E3FC278|nr:VOC family protein [Methanosarcina sp. DH2]MCC4770474.1 VOC family protein [Methanosarcina sp. DH2]